MHIETPIMGPFSDMDGARHGEAERVFPYELGGEASSRRDRAGHSGTAWWTSAITCSSSFYKRSL